ncbi:MAG: GNAT family acetyltransferase [Eubacteriales bacterium]|nr:GNAT family acetyltransferase [Eubacteriales bacterium]
MIEKMLPFQFVKKSPFYGSWKGMNYRIIAKEGKLETCVFPGPYIFDKTPEEKKTYAIFDFSEEGYDAAIDFLNKEFRTGEWRKKA